MEPQLTRWTPGQEPRTQKLPCSHWVNTEFKLIGPDHKIVIESYDDPKIDGITVFISKSQKGGIESALGLAEDTSDASVAVRQTGPIKVKEAFDNGEDAFTEKRSVLFKRLHVSRF